MPVGQPLNVSGCVTKDKFIRGKTIEEIEKLIGFHRGRLASGLTVVKLNRLPAMNEFDLAAYSNVATHRLQVPTGLDIDKLKRLAIESWSLSGVDRLVKVLAAIRHDNSMDPDVQYPPGQGIPQWKVTVQIPGVVIAEVAGTPGTRYQPAQ
jgi:hypothetical protein